MDETRFDRLTRTFGFAGSRRAALAGGIATLFAAVGFDDALVKKKHKKKCKKPRVKCKKKCCAAGQICSSGKCTAPPPPPAEECQFTKTATLWTLQADCTISKTIDIPNGVTLDGNGKTITMSGNVANYFKEVPDDWAVAAGLLANGGSANVHDLTIRGSGLTGSCNPTGPEGLAFINTSGTIERVTVKDILLSDAFAPCGSCITATGTGGQTVTIAEVTVSGCPDKGVWGLTRANTPGVTVNLDGATVTMDVEAPPFSSAGIAYRGGRVAGAIANAAISLSAQEQSGIVLTGQGQMTGQIVEIADVTITGNTNIAILAAVVAPESGAFTVNVTRADITLATDVATGIYFPFSGEGVDVSGTVDDSIIRGGGTAIFLEGANELTVQNTTIEDSEFGVVNFGGGSLDAHDNSLTGVVFGMGFSPSGPVPSDATITNNTIEGRSATAQSAFGVLFSDGATGTVSGNTISNFFDTDPMVPSCGIAVFENAGEVTIEDNTFPDPPGNEENICLDVPVPTALRHRKNEDGDPLGIEALGRRLGNQHALHSDTHGGRDRRTKAKAGHGRGRHHGKDDKR